MSQRSVAVAIKLLLGGPVDPTRFLGCENYVDLRLDEWVVATTPDAIRMANCAQAINDQRQAEGKPPMYEVKTVPGGYGKDFEKDLLDPRIQGSHLVASDRVAASPEQATVPRLMPDPNAKPPASPAAIVPAGATLPEKPTILAELQGGAGAGVPPETIVPVTPAAPAKEPWELG